MFVCLCNGYTDRDILEASRAGAATVDEIYAHLGGEPQCGKCLDYAEALLARAGKPDASLAAVLAPLPTPA